MKISLPVFCLCCMMVVKKNRNTKNDVLYFSPRGTHSGILCYIFSARGTRSGVIVLYFPRVERAMALLCYTFPHMERALALFCYIFREWNALWSYCVIFSTCGTGSDVIVLYFTRVELALVFCVKLILCCNIPTL